MAGKTWVLDTSTKGTGASVRPLEDVVEKPEPAARPRRRARAPEPSQAPRAPRPKRERRPAERTSTPLPPGHVRKRATGEIGKVLSVDAKAGTATVRWLKRGSTSSVPLSSVSRH